MVSILDTIPDITIDDAPNDRKTNNMWSQSCWFIPHGSVEWKFHCDYYCTDGYIWVCTACDMKDKIAVFVCDTGENLLKGMAFSNCEPYWEMIYYLENMQHTMKRDHKETKINIIIVADKKSHDVQRKSEQISQAIKDYDLVNHNNIFRLVGKHISYDLPKFFHINMREVSKM